MDGIEVRACSFDAAHEVALDTKVVPAWFFCWMVFVSKVLKVKSCTTGAFPAEQSVLHRMHMGRPNEPEELCPSRV